MLESLVRESMDRKAEWWGPHDPVDFGFPSTLVPRQPPSPTMHPIQVNLVRLSTSLLHHLKTIKTSDDEVGVREAKEAALNVLVSLSGCQHRF